MVPDNLVIKCWNFSIAILASIPYKSYRFMNRFILSMLSLAAAVGLSACDKNKNNPRLKPAPGPKVTEPRTPGPDSGDGDLATVDKKKKDEVVDPTPAVKSNKIPPPPVQTPEYAIKVDGKPGYVKSPYDGQGRLIDVRGLPPGTEAECPYTRRTFLVPP